jgi:hypothetical protein
VTIRGAELFGGAPPDPVVLPPGDWCDGVAVPEVFDGGRWCAECMWTRGDEEGGHGGA